MTKPSFAHEARALILLAGPIVVTQVGQMAIGTTDVLMLGAFAKDALAVSALGLSLYFSFLMFGMGPPTAVSPMIAHVLGDSDADRAGVAIAVRMAFWAVLAITPLLVFPLYFAEDMLLLIGEPPELAAAAGLFVRVFSLSLPFALAYNVLRSYVTALSRPTPALIVMLLAILFNIVADYALIFGHFGLPRWGLFGSAIASSLSNIFSFVALTAVVQFTPALAQHRIFHDFFVLDRHRLAEVFRLGLPIGLTLVFEVLFFCGGTLVMGHFGAAAVAAHQIALTTASTTFMVPLGIAMAATVRVGLAAGAGDYPRVRRAGLAAMAVGAGFMSCCGLAMLLIPEWIASLYVDPSLPENRPVIANAVTYLHFAAAFQLMDAIQVTASLSLRGMKDATMPMWLAGCAYWLIGFPLAIWLAFPMGLQGIGVWCAFVVALTFAAIALSLRFAILSGIIARAKT